MAKVIVFLLIMGFSVVKALINAAQEKAKAEQLRQQAQGGRPNRQRTVQNEIDAFLKDASPQRPRQAQETDSIQARDRRERRRRQVELKKREDERKRLKEGMPKTKRPMGTSVGTGVGKHVDTYINKHVDTYLDHDVDEYVEATIVENLESKFGKRTMGAAPTTTRTKNKAAESVAALLKNPAGVRNAILVNEILSRPRVLSKQRNS